MTHEFKAKIVLNGEMLGWKRLELEYLPRSCGCDGSLEENLIWAAGERFAEIPTDQIEIETFRQLKRDTKVGTEVLYVCRFHREYGGPEEGGWWYDTQEVIKSFEVPSKNVVRHLTRLQRFCEAYNRDIKSWDYSSKLHVTVYKQKRSSRPHYC